MNRGELDRLIRLQRGTITPGPISNETTWADLATVSARRADVADAERFAAGQMSGNRVTRWIVAWRPDLADLSGADRLEYPVDSGKFAGILGAKEPVGTRRQWIEITAAEESH